MPPEEYGTRIRRQDYPQTTPWTGTDGRVPARSRHPGLVSVVPAHRSPRAGLWFARRNHLGVAIVITYYSFFGQLYKWRLLVIIGNFPNFRAEGGELQSVLDREEVPQERDVIRFLRQVLGGLAFLHRFDIAHLDLKVCTQKNTKQWCI